METAATQNHMAVATPAGAEAAKNGQHTLKAFGDDGFDFFDLIDMINPLQHIPVVSTLYRSVTGDSIGALPRIVGGALLGGPIGAGAALANVALESATGKDAGDHVLAMFQDDQGASEPMVASAAGQTQAPRQIGSWINPDYAPVARDEHQIAAAEGSGSAFAGLRSPSHGQVANAWWTRSPTLNVGKDPVQLAEAAAASVPQKADPFAALRHAQQNQAQLQAEKTVQSAKNEQRAPETSPEWFSTKVMHGLDLYRTDAKARMQGQTANLKI